ncbi:MAG: hypothetical protein FJX22_03095 [Alphaproteobacteria bacterium]|nr:hypothetical protein [Alphaproteobacteria bacterium]
MTQPPILHHTWQSIADFVQDCYTQAQQGLTVDLRDISALVDQACQQSMALPAVEREGLLATMHAVVQQLDALEAVIKAQKDLVAVELSSLSQRGRAMSAYLNASANNAAGNPSASNRVSNEAKPPHADNATPSVPSVNAPDSPGDDTNPL